MVFTDQKMRFSIETGKNETFYLKPTFSIENQTYITYDMFHFVNGLFRITGRFSNLNGSSKKKFWILETAEIDFSNSFKVLIVFSYKNRRFLK